MRSILLVFVIAFFVASCGQDAGVDPSHITASPGVDISGESSNFLVKLTSDISPESNKPGDPVTGVLIDPTIFRGGRVEGTIELAHRSDIQFSFHTVHFDGSSYAIESTVTSVVNSKGNAGHDDFGQRIRVAGGTVIAHGTTTAISEGAEIRFVAWQE